MTVLTFMRLMGLLLAALGIVTAFVVLLDDAAPWWLSIAIGVTAWLVVLGAPRALHRICLRNGHHIMSDGRCFVCGDKVWPHS